MDSVRLGKALGIGTRAVARAVAAAASAPPTVSSPPRSRVPVTASGLREGGRRFRRAVWTPAARLSAVLWLEITGLFFGLFATIGASYCWHQRALLHTRQQKNFYVMIAMTLLFSYFCLSSFYRARQRGRR